MVESPARLTRQNGTKAAPRLWDPLRILPEPLRRGFWILLAIAACAVQGPAFVRSLRPAPETGVDFLQEWTSAQNYFEGLPIYTPHRVTFPRYLGWETRWSQTTRRVNIDRNAHPPTSVLLGLPFAWLPYPDAVLAWNIVSLVAFAASLWLVAHNVGIRFGPWSVFPLVALLLICSPFRQQVGQGQLNLPLLLLLTGIWLADRSGRLCWAGVLLGLATAVKLFPGFLFLYFVARREWKAVVVGTLSVVLLTGLTAVVLGPSTYQAYVSEVLPEVDRFRSGWINASLAGFWTKLFDPATDHERVQPVWRVPVLARLGWLLSALLIVGLVGWTAWQARTQEQRDRAFGLAVTGMLLVSPITWDHYFLLLVLPGALTWTGLPRHDAARLLFLVALLLLWVEPRLLYDLFIAGGYADGMAYPVHTLCVLSLQLYALLALFGLQLAAMANASGRSATGCPGEAARA